MKHLGSQITIHALFARFALAHTSFNKLQHPWRSKLPRKVKVQIFIADIVSCLIYGIGTLTMEDKHFRKLDSWWFQHLPRAIGIKASYYSHITNESVWIQANRPLLPSQIVRSQQFKLLVESVRVPGDQPLHHVVHGPALKDRIARYKNHKTGPPPPLWLLLVSNHALEYCRSETPNMDLLTLQKLIRKEPDFPAPRGRAYAPPC